jgi:hypothetical protein
MVAGIDKKGAEIVDSKQMELPLGFKYPESLEVTMRKHLMAESELANRLGVDTEEEANDFDVGDDEPLAPWEYTIDQEIEDREKRFKFMEARKKEQSDFDQYTKWKETRAQPASGAAGSNNTSSTAA